MKIMLTALLSTFIFLKSFGFASGDTPLIGWNKLMADFFKSGNELYSEEDVNLLAEVMYHENHCNGEYVMKLTGSVVLNRVKCEWYPDNIYDVLHQYGQYATVDEFFTDPLPDYMYGYARELLIFGSIAPDYVLFQSMDKDLGDHIWYEKNGEYFAY